jgi:DNA-binding NarL/FixJ family response regulator
MAAAPDGRRRDNIHRPDALHPLSPLKREERDWKAIYRTYSDLPKCEHHVLDLLVGRKEPKQVARELGVTWHTVRNQISTLQKKFNADSTQELVILIAVALYEEARRGEVSNDE